MPAKTVRFLVLRERTPEAPCVAEATVPESALSVPVLAQDEQSGDYVLLLREGHEEEDKASLLALEEAPGLGPLSRNLSREPREVYVQVPEEAPRTKYVLVPEPEQPQAAD